MFRKKLIHVTFFLANNEHIMICFLIITANISNCLWSSLHFLTTDGWFCIDL
jgi:hypothetical protein